MLAPLTPSPGSTEEVATFKSLQSKLQARFLRFRDDPGRPYTAVIVPSLSFDPDELAKIDGVAHYEERSLFNIMLLRHPRLRVIYVTSKRLNPLTVDYYLHHMRSIPTEHARRRLCLFDCDDASPRPLTAKILERPRLLARIRDAISDPENAHLGVFCASSLERTLAVQLGIPMNACDPDLREPGTKSGSRAVFREAGVDMAPGHERLRDRGDLTAAVARLWGEVPDMGRVVVKLEEGFSGEGNAILDLRPLAEHRAAPATTRETVIRGALTTLRPEAAGLAAETFLEQFDRMGGICEQWIEGEGKVSPSAQVRINPLHETQMVSTHDQVLGGPTGQVFEGAFFPAHESYRAALQGPSRRIGEVLAKRGVIGRFGVDYLVVPKPDAPPAVYAVEINLRQGGTTHPFNTLKFLTDGRYDEESGRFYTAHGQERCYFATDTLRSPDYRGLLPFDLMDMLVRNGIHFRADETGVVFHLLGCLSEFGKIGCIAIAPTRDESHRLYRDWVATLDRATGRSP